MIFWLSAAALVAFVLLLLLRTLVVPPKTESAVSEDVAFFRAQDAEIDRQLAIGMIDEAEARSAKAEAARRLITLSRQSGPEEKTDGKRSRAAQVLVALAVPALALPLYLKLGAPNLPAQPFASRTDLNRGQVDLERMVERLDAHLQESPDDAKGFELAYPVYMRTGRFEQAQAAAQRLIELKGPAAERYAALAEAGMFAAQGEVTAEVRAALEKALDLDPKLARARFYSAIAAEQGGDRAKALDILKALDGDLPEGQEKRAVASQIARLSAPPASAAEALRNLPKDQQDQSIRAMVDGLETRLKDKGGSADDWQKLVRALAVLGDKPRAAAALKLAREALASDQAALGALGELARQYTIEQGGPQ